MASASDYRFTVYVNDIPRTLFSLRLTKHDDLILVPKQAQVWRDTQYYPNPAIKDIDLVQSFDEPGLHGAEILHQRYSIHPSKDSENYNILQHTCNVAGRLKPIRTRHTTRALKANNNFAPLYTRRAPDLGIDRYIPKTKAHHITIGTYEPDVFTLIYSVMISSANRTFNVKSLQKLPPPLYANISEQYEKVNERHFRVGDYCVTVLYTYLTLPSGSKSVLHHYICDEESMSKAPQTAVFANGLDEAQAISAFTHDCILATEEWRGTREKEGLLSGLDKLLLDCKGFCKEGTKSSECFAHYLRFFHETLRANPSRYEDSK